MLRSADDLTRYVLEDPLCRRLAALGEAAGTRLVLVGGCVRDWLLDRPALDWDLIVPGDPAPLLVEARKALGRQAVTLDEGFGVYRLAMPDGPVVDFTRLQGESLDDDLRRRDLTVNALGVDLATGELLDPTGGYGDLMAMRVRAVSRRNLDDDPLRLVRVFRFAATLPGTLDAETLGWVRELAPRVRQPATERVWAELGKLLATPRAAEVLEGMAETGLLAELLPELAPDAAVRARRLEAALARLGELGPGGERARRELAEPLTGNRPRLAPLYLTAMLAERADRPAADVERLSSRLRWSKREAAWGHKLPGLARRVAALPAADAPARERFRLHKAAQDALPGVVAIALANGHPVSPDLLDEHWRHVDHPLPRLVDGHDLMNELGVKPGRQIATLLEGVEEAQALGEVGDRAAALAWVAAGSGNNSHKNGPRKEVIPCRTKIRSTTQQATSSTKNAKKATSSRSRTS